MSTNEQLAELIQSGHDELLVELWEKNHKLLTMLTRRAYRLNANRLNAAGINLDDYIQESYFALMEAVRAYKPNGEFKFTAYLSYSLRNRIRSLLGKPNDAALRCISLDEPLTGSDDSDGEQLTIGDTLSDTEADTEGTAVEHNYVEQLHDDISESLKCLTPFERQIISERFYNNIGIPAIAIKNNITAQEAAKAYKTSMYKLRNGKARMKLRAYRNAVISQYAYNGSFTAWREKESSSTEITVLRLLETNRKD